MPLSLKTVGFILIFLTAVLWGPNFLFIKVAVVEIPPVSLVFLRVAIGAIVLFLVSLFQKINLWHYRHFWKNFFVMGLFMNVIPFILISWGEIYISSALAGILNSLSVVFTAVLAHYFGPDDPLTRGRIGGISSAMVGLVIIYFPMLLSEPMGNILGALMIVIASLSYGIGAVYVRSHLRKIPSMAALPGQMIASTAILLPLSLLVDRPFSLPFPSANVIYAVVLLGAIGTGISFIFYYKAIQLAGATYATLSVFLLALIAMLCGAVFLDEKISWNLYLGALFILAGLLAVNPAFDKSKTR